MKEQLAVPRLLAGLVVAIGAAALFIAAVGLAGVLAHQVATRSRELSIRAALGATRSQIVGGVVRGALTVTLGGTFTGLVAAFVLARWLSTVVTGVDVHDPIAFVAGPLALLVVVFVASVAPARRAAAIDPARTLRA